MSTELVVASYNVWVMAPRNTAAQLELLWREGVEVAGLQEVSEGVADPHIDGGAVVNRLTAITGGPYEHVAFGRAITRGGGEYGNVVVSKLPFTGVETLDLPRAAGAEDRCAVRVEMQVAGRSLSFYTAHLAYESTELRVRQLEALRRVLDRDLNEYRVLTGDFNTDQTVAEFDLFLDGYRLVNGHEGDWRETFRADTNASMKHRMIDNIIVSRNIGVRSWEVVDSDLSDHSPVKATLVLG